MAAVTAMAMIVMEVERAHLVVADAAEAVILTAQVQ